MPEHDSLNNQKIISDRLDYLLLSITRYFYCYRVKPDLTLPEYRSYAANSFGFEISDNFLIHLYNIGMFNEIRSKHSDKLPKKLRVGLTIRKIIHPPNNTHIISFDLMDDFNLSNTKKSHISCVYNADEHSIVIESLHPTIFVLKGYSIGKKILSVIERYAKARGVKSIKINSPNSNAIGFYEKCGYLKENDFIKYY